MTYRQMTHRIAAKPLIGVSAVVALLVLASPFAHAGSSGGSYMMTAGDSGASGAGGPTATPGGANGSETTPGLSGSTTPQGAPNGTPSPNAGTPDSTPGQNLGTSPPGTPGKVGPTERSGPSGVYKDATPPNSR